MATLTALITITPTIQYFIEITLNNEQTHVTQLRVNGRVAQEDPNNDKCLAPAADNWIIFQGSGWKCGWTYQNGQLVYRCVPA